MKFTKVNSGNFLELIRFRIHSGDDNLKEHIKTAPSNAKYLSKTIQNELIELCGKNIISKVVSEIKQCGISQL